MYDHHMQWKQRRPLDHEFEIRNKNCEAQMFHLITPTQQEFFDVKGEYH